MRSPNVTWLVLMLVAAPLAAQEGGESVYRGVVPGRGETPAHIRAAQGAEARLLTWPGFQLRPDGASRFFLQTSRDVRTETRASPGRFSLIIKETKIFVRNNGRPLETKYFETPVSRAVIRRLGQDVEVDFELRAEVTPFVRAEAGADGFHYVFVEFPPGDYGRSEGD